ncbi:acid phosphatase/Vanadium-dependent haloperoxidase [Wolfiporia cocos MD-104 SS10]|uniref:Acid phosphatase/Vanadium-dependent haloperoxidase n=1 Tax=Wolfiporia cocos (strain MD-104) TaxID=742152 RepID=A0A2H3J8R6_WOLCO|nr:acid phosphatase/Vanadium-dependent haloperoxidase [Wolfiporia cocos MD-104 SS10]
MYSTTMDRLRQRQLIFSYAPDWSVTIVLGVFFISLNEVPGFKRDFSLQDQTLYHPYAVHERVPPAALYMIAGAAPFILQGVINFFTVRSWWDFHNSTLGLLLSVALAGSITQFTKITVGRPRPDLIARCIPRAGAVDPPYGLSTAAICTQTDKFMMTDGWRSFPSGHSSLSFAGLGFLTFYLAGKLHLFDHRGCAPKAWAALTPLSAAALVAISRTMDYRHHATDVLTGSLLGIISAYFSYRQYYPSLASERSHRPYSPRVRHEDLLPVHARSASQTLALTAHEEYRDNSLAVETVPHDEHGHELWKDDGLSEPSGSSGERSD